jgi:hypothetical protein
MDAALWMVGAYVLRLPLVNEILIRGGIVGPRAELPAGLTLEDAETLVTAVHRAEASYKLVIALLDGSTLAGQLEQLEAYAIDVEVLAPVYVSGYSRWREEVLVSGSLRADDWGLPEPTIQSG